MNLKGLRTNEWHDTSETGLRVLYQEINDAYDVSLWNIGKQSKTILIEGIFKSILPEQLYTVTGLSKLDGLDCQIYYENKWSEVDVKQPAKVEQSPPNISPEKPHHEKGRAYQLSKSAKIQPKSNAQQITPSQISKKQLDGPKSQVEKPANEPAEIRAAVHKSTRELERVEQLIKQWKTFKQQYREQYDELKRSIGELKENISQLQDSFLQDVLKRLREEVSHLPKALNLLDEIERKSTSLQDKIQKIQEYHEEIESGRSNSQRLAEAIEQNLEKGLGYLKEIEQTRDDIFEIKAEIREEILDKAQEAIIQADEKQKQLKDRLERLDEFEYRDLERKKQEIARQIRQTAMEIQRHYLEKMSSDASFQSSQKQSETLSAILSQVTAFKNALVKADYSKDAIPQAVAAVEYLVESTLQTLELPLPKIIIPDVSSPKECERQQAHNLAQMALTEHPPEKLHPGAIYIDYVWQEYWNALLEYKKELDEVNPEEHLREAQSKVDGVLKDISGNLMDAFDEGKAVDDNQKEISVYFNNQYSEDRAIGGQSPRYP